ncbi:pali-domain-containing protein [Decorospora gaudefroyi]|uniref:Pali-domain-containing protein n=1 Tax=Decorospora gaudefroyi TaxID=184978 RepID=A0A6A5KR38_9PLEO|nr:pali-domain-containing protein [Decorospora gaudefroyi]
MLRPATPLSILFFIAFVLLLLATLSTPIIKSIPLATYRGIHFGVLGYCENGNSGCQGPMIGYNTEDLFRGQDSTDFSLPSAQRHALASLLIVHPVAALMTLICFGLSAAAHLHSPAHSPRYLLALLIFTFPTLLVSLLAFLVDILLFVPHVGWGGWIVLGATIIIVASGIVTCAMRRTLVSRKARKRRIAENDEMNGQTYYANRNNPTVAADFPKAESPPPLSGETMTSGPRANDNAVYFDTSKPSPTDDMTPLNQRDPSLKTVSSAGGNNGSDTLGPPYRGPSGRRQPMDQYGNPIPMPNDGYTINAPSRGRGGPYRGRGGPPRGGPRGGGYGPRGGMRGPPPPGWNGNGRGGRLPNNGVPMQGPPMGRGGPPPGYNNNNFYNQPPSNRGPPPPGSMAAMPIGQAIEMDNRTGTPPTNYGLRESDGDVAGMLALQQGGFPADAPQRRPSDGMMSPTSEYSTDDSQQYRAPPQQQQQQYIPVRAGWNQQKMPSDQTVSTVNNSSRGLSPIQDSPVELPTQISQVGAPTSNRPERSSDYYEDVDPRFAEPVQAQAPPALPTSLMPGGFTSANPHYLSAANSSDTNLPRTHSFDDLPEGSRSPAVSEASHFTSVSQRPVNPNWRPEMGAAAGQFAPFPGARRPLRQEDVILEANAANPDFVIPGAGRGRGRGRGGRGRGGAMMPPPATMIGQGPGLSNQSRYPGANAM